jgi:hypothetical protein
MKLVFACAFLIACGGGGGGATVIEVPPQDLPSPPPPQQQGAIAQPETVAPPMQRGEEWVGKYQCAQGMTDVVLHVQAVHGNQVIAVFEFLHGPSGAGGSYHMRGQLDPSGGLVFVPGAWIDQPPNYVTVGMRGTITGNVYSGRIDNSSCGMFSVTRR